MQNTSSYAEREAGEFRSFTVKDLLDEGRTRGVKLVRFMFSDTCGILRGKASSIETALPRFLSGIGIVKGTLAMNMLDALQSSTGLGAVGEVRLIPDLSSFKILPYTVGSASVFCDLLELDGKPWSHCPRAFLRRQIDQLAALGYEVRVAFEPEFTLGVDSGAEFLPADSGLCFSSESMDATTPFIMQLMECLESLNLAVEQYYPELGAGQHEVSLKPKGPLAACDQHILLKETIRALARSQGLSASFAPKVAEDFPGNGCHVHLSLWKDGKNVFYEEGSPLSKIGRHFVAGLLEHLRALCAITCPSVNSYRRLKPDSWSSAYTVWGLENREAAVRVPSTYRGREAETTNIEIKCVDNSANPYLALGALIAAGLDGIRRQLEPPPPVQVNPSELEEEQKRLCKVRNLPRSLSEALSALEEDNLILAALGELAPTFIAVKTSEEKAFAGKGDLEFSSHRARY